MNRTPQTLQLGWLRGHRHNPRRQKTSISELCDSIETHGLLDPVLVREISGGAEVGSVYEILSGHRRVEAARCLEWAEIDAVVLDPCSDTEALEVLLTANEQREDVDPIAEASAIDALVKQHGGNVSNVAARLGRSVGWVASRRALAGLSETWKGRFHQRPWSVWPMRCWTLLAGLVAEEQDRFSSSAMVQYWLDKPDPDPKRLERELQDWVRVLGKAPFDVRDASLAPEAGACDVCPKTSQSTPGLFDDGEPYDLATARCRDRKCWDLKCRRMLQARVKAAKAEHGKDLVVVLPKSHAGPTPKGTRVLGGDRYVKAKKGEKGAVPALSAVGGSTAVTYVKVREARAPAAPGAGRKPKKPSIEDLEARHEVAVIVQQTKALHTAFRKIAHAPATVVLTLVEAYGIRRWRQDKHRMAILAMAIQRPSFEERLADLWKDVREGISLEHRGPYSWDYVTPSKALAEAREALGEAQAVASLLSLTVDLDAAAAKVKAPKALQVAREKGPKPARKAATKKGAKRKTARRKKVAKRKVTA